MIASFAPLALAALLTLVATWPANAAPVRTTQDIATPVQNVHGRDRYYDRRWYGPRPGYYPPQPYYRPYYPAPRYYAPPPYYYAPPRYYAPPPRYYAPPPGLYFEFRN